MKKMRTRIFCFVEALMISIMCGTVSVYGEETLYNSKTVYDGSETFNVLNSILVEGVKTRTSQYSDFISSYAGSKIGDDGTLIVYFKNNCKSNIINDIKSELMTFGVPNCAIEFEGVGYSEMELMSYRDSIWEEIYQCKENGNEPSLKGWADKFVATSIDPETNRVELYVKDFSAVDYTQCDNIFAGFPYEIEVLSGGYDMVEESTLKPGQAVSSTGGSIGFRCKLDGVKGFVTATHTSTEDNVTNRVNVKIGGVTVGKVTAGIYDGKADFTFVEITNSSYDVGRTTNTSPSYTLHETHYIVSLPEGYAVYMAGQKSTQVRSGTVYRYDYAINPNSSWLLCDYPSESGDSGGCVFANVNGDYCVLGIHDGSYGSDYTYSTKLTTMKDYYDLVIY